MFDLSVCVEDVHVELNRLAEEIRSNRSIQYRASFLSVIDRACLFLPCEAFVEKSQDFRYIKLNVFQFEFVLSIFLHFEQIIEFQIEFEKSSCTS